MATKKVGSKGPASEKEAPPGGAAAAGGGAGNRPLLERPSYPDEPFDSTERALDLLEPAWADYVYGLRTTVRLRRDTPGFERVNNLSLSEVAQRLNAYRQRFESGDPVALLNALVFAMTESVPVPYWIATQVAERVDRTTSMKNLEPVSLHDAFGLGKDIPLTNDRYRAARRDLTFGYKLWREVTQYMHVNNVALSPALARVLDSGRFPFSRTKARELFDQRDQLQRQLLGRRPRKRGVKKAGK